MKQLFKDIIFVIAMLAIIGTTVVIAITYVLATIAMICIIHIYIYIKICLAFL